MLPSNRRPAARWSRERGQRRFLGDRDGHPLAWTPSAYGAQQGVTILMSRKIPPDLEPLILAKFGKGGSSRSIANWLKTEHSVECSYGSVARLLKRARTERADVAKAIIREKLGAVVLNDLDRLSFEQRRVEKLARRLHKRACASLDAIDDSKGVMNPESLRLALQAVDSFVDLALKASDRVRTLADRKLHYSGADSDDADQAKVNVFPTDFSGVTDEQLNRLARGVQAGGSARDAQPDRFACECGLEVSEQLPVCPKCGLDMDLDAPPKGEGDHARDRENAGLMKTFEEQRERRK